MKMTGISPLPWEPICEKIIVADPPRYRVAIRAANGYRVVIEDNPDRWEQAQVDYERICAAVNDPRWQIAATLAVKEPKSEQL